MSCTRIEDIPADVNWILDTETNNEAAQGGYGRGVLNFICSTLDYGEDYPLLPHSPAPLQSTASSLLPLKLQAATLPPAESLLGESSNTLETSKEPSDTSSGAPESQNITLLPSPNHKNQSHAEKEKKGKRKNENTSAYLNTLMSSSPVVSTIQKNLCDKKLKTGPLAQSKATGKKKSAEEAAAANRSVIKSRAKLKSEKQKVDSEIKRTEEIKHKLKVKAEAVRLLKKIPLPFFAEQDTNYKAEEEQQEGVAEEEQRKSRMKTPRSKLDAAKKKLEQLKLQVEDLEKILIENQSPLSEADGAQIDSLLEELSKKSSIRNQSTSACKEVRKARANEKLSESGYRLPTVIESLFFNLFNQTTHNGRLKVLYGSPEEMRTKVLTLYYETQIVPGRVAWPEDMGSPEDWLARCQADGEMTVKDINMVTRAGANILNRDIVVFSDDADLTVYKAGGAQLESATNPLRLFYHSGDKSSCSTPHYQTPVGTEFAAKLGTGSTGTDLRKASVQNKAVFDEEADTEDKQPVTLQLRQEQQWKNGDDLLYHDPDDPAGQLRKALISIGEDGVLQLTDIHTTSDDLVVEAMETAGLSDSASF